MSHEKCATGSDCLPRSRTVLSLLDDSNYGKKDLTCFKIGFQKNKGFLNEPCRKIEATHHWDAK